MNHGPPPPFVIPPIITYAIPGFVILILAEMIYIRITKRGGSYQVADSASSLLMGFGNQVSGLLFGGLAVWCYYAAYQFRFFTLGWNWQTMLACFFAEDLAYYWFHRIAHERRWFWASHVIHHSSQHYNLTTALRQTWWGTLTFSFIFWLPLMLVGFPPEMVLMFSAISLVYQFWIHTETIDKLPFWFEAVMNTPSHHRVHHATNAKYLDANYAGVLIIWDRIFGSFVPEDAAEKPHYGIVSNLGTFNPIRVALHELAGIWRDVTHAKSLREVAGYMFGPPGWSPDGSRKTSASIKAAWRARQAVPFPPAFTGEVSRTAFATAAGSVSAPSVSLRSTAPPRAGEQTTP